MSEGRILVIDDEPDMLSNCARLLEHSGYECHTLGEPMRFREAFFEAEPDVLLLDLRMPGRDGLEVLAEALALEPNLPVVIMTAYATVASAVKAIRQGAFDYLAKPFSAEELAVTVERAIRFRGLAVDNRRLRRQLIRPAAFDGVIGSSPAMDRLFSDISRVAPSSADVLILGESGTGKELVARSIHTLSDRSQTTFFPLDCASLPESLLESELFGHEKGAFTGAIALKTGLLVEAQGGTVFLDEVTELTPALQSKLLRALEERQVRKVGSNVFEELDIRVIAATNADIEGAVEDGRFRQDLYYRLAVVSLQIPPLRDRGGDIELLLTSFLQEFAELQGIEAPRLAPDVTGALNRHLWPGNVRELRNLAHRLVVFDDDGVISIADLPDSIRGWEDPTDSEALEALPYETAREEVLSAFRSRYCKQLLAKTDGNITKAASMAGVSRRTFHRWLAENDAPRDDNALGKA